MIDSNNIVDIMVNHANLSRISITYLAICLISVISIYASMHIIEKIAGFVNKEK